MRNEKSSRNLFNILVVVSWNILPSKGKADFESSFYSLTGMNFLLTILSSIEILLSNLSSLSKFPLSHEYFAHLPKRKIFSLE